MLSLMYMYFIQMLPVIIHSVSLLLTNAMKMLYKKCEYSHQVREVEHGVFTPPVFTSTGGGYGLGGDYTFYKCLADLLASYPLRTTLQYHNSLVKVPHVLCPALVCHLVYLRELVYHPQPCSRITRLVSGPC